MSATDATALTPLDRIARFPRDLVVQAGAGTGKTHALVTLYLHLVGGATASRMRVAPSRIAVVTFTEKAAGELKERLRGRLGALAAAPAELERLEPTLAAAARAFGVTLPDGAGWTEALLGLGAAPVGTFHSFAGSLLRRHAARAGIDPEYALLDEAEVAARTTQAAERAILDALTAGDENVEELVAQLGFRGIGRARGLVELLGTLRGQRAEEGRGAAGLDGNYEPAAMQRELEAALAEFRIGTRGLYAVAEQLGPKTKSAPRARELCARLPALDFTRGEDVAELMRGLTELRGGGVAELKESLRAAATRLGDAQAGVRAVPLVRALTALVGAVADGYRAHKRRAGAVDFADLLVLARDLLRDDATVRAAVRGRFDAVLVDEFQDTNPVQAELVELIGTRQPDDERARLFVVGDRKQSIYEFRGADVAVFARASADVVTRGGGEELLTQSRRSAPSVLALCNGLFARAMGGATADAAWDVAYEPARDDLSALRSEPAVAGGAELLRVEPGPAAAARAREARAIARRIAQLRADGRRLGDVAILLRRFTHVVDYLDALRTAGLPYFVVRGRGFFAAQEVRDLASALTVLDDPDDLLALVAVLRSPIVGVSDETLARLSLAGQLRARVLLDAGTVLPAALPEPERLGLQRFAAQFRELKATADRLGPAACAQAIVDGADLVAVLAATADGEQRVANLARLIERAREFEARGGDLRAFANWLRRAAMPGGEAEAAQAQIADERDDVVRVMTVHQAKGLEFPVVFVPACGALERVDGSPVLYDAGAGLGLKMRDERRPVERTHTSVSRHIAELRKRRQQAESLRVFYVAATRARDLVVFSGEQPFNRPNSGTWRLHLDALAADERTGALLRVVDGDQLPAPPATLEAVAEEPADLEAESRARLAAVTTRPQPRPSSLTVAVTQLADFELCPRRYQQFHALGLQEHPSSSRAPSPDVLVDVDEDAPPALDPLRRGTLAHRLLERAPFRADGPDLGALDRLLAADGYDPQQREVAEVRSHVAGFLGTPFARGLDGVAVRRELPFLLAVPFDGAVLYLRGQMDLVVLSSEGVTVIDYKHARQGDPEDYRFQLDAYALAARRLYPQAPAIRTGLAFLKEGDPSPAVAVAAAPAAFETALATLGRDLATARAAERWEMRALSACHRLRCGFIYRCYPTER